MCGFIGIISDTPAAPDLYLGLQAVQHRGQDAAGIATWTEGRLKVHRDLGLISQALPAHLIRAMEGTAGIAHVRYPTHGKGSRANAQPFTTRRPAVALAHNGNLVNAEPLHGHLQRRGITALSTSDSELILLLFGDELLKRGVANYTEQDVVEALRQSMEQLRGSYSVALIMEIDGEPTLLAFRDRHGFRPCAYGRRADGAWAVASESVSLDVTDFELVGHLPAGSAILLRHGREPIIHPIATPNPRPCIFEDIYFARPDSRTEGGRVNRRRWSFGEQLAEEWAAKGFQADVVIAVPDTSRPAAQAMAEKLGLPHREGFIKNRYSGRTFIMPDPQSRDTMMRLKLNPIEEYFRDQRVVLVDDSIVRGTTMRRIIRMVRRLDPRALHVAIFSPPVRHPCYYGIDMPTSEELVASAWEPAALEARLAEHLEADSVTFLSEAGMRAVAGQRICAACFTGAYPVPVQPSERGYILRDRHHSSAG